MTDYPTMDNPSRVYNLPKDYLHNYPTAQHNLHLNRDKMVWCIRIHIFQNWTFLMCIPLMEPRTVGRVPWRWLLSRAAEWRGFLWSWLADTRWYYFFDRESKQKWWWDDDGLSTYYCSSTCHLSLYRPPRQEQLAFYDALLTNYWGKVEGVVKLHVDVVTYLTAWGRVCGCFRCWHFHFLLPM